MRKRKSFHEIYADVSTTRRDALREFRRTHPYTLRILQNAEWDYIDTCQGNETLLILGGALSTGESSFRTVTRLEDHFRVISPSYPTVEKMNRLCDGLIALLDVERIPQAHIYGHSLGAAVAHTLVRRHPDRVGKLILSGFGLYNPQSIRLAKLYFFLFDLLPYSYLRGVYARRIPHLLEGTDADEQRFIRAYFLDLLDIQHNKGSIMSQFRVMVDMVNHPDIYKVFEPIERPGQVLMLQAKDDHGFNADEQEALRTTYPGAQIHLFEAGGHWSMLTQREVYETAIDTFLGLAPRPDS